MAQQIVVHGDGSHEQVVRAAALASAEAAYLTKGHTAWETWLNGPFVKTVRRCKKSEEFLDLTSRFAASRVSVEQVYAFGMIPCYFSDLSEDVKKTQVANFVRPRTGEWGGGAFLDVFQIAINPEVEMSTGKTAAQVAHAVFKLAKEYGYESVHANLQIHSTQEWFQKMLSFPSHDSIHDAGLTEIAPRTETVRYGVYSAVYS